jgi:hypothetical protein
MLLRRIEIVPRIPRTRQQWWQRSPDFQHQDQLNYGQLTTPRLTAEAVQSGDAEHTMQGAAAVKRE